MLGQYRAHLEVCNAHLSSKGHTFGFLLRINCTQVLTINILRHVSIICLCYGHHLILTRHIAKVDVRSSEFFLQTHRVCLKATTCLIDECRFCLTSVGTRLSKVDRVGWPGDGLLFGNLAAVPLTLSNTIVCLTLSGDGPATPVDVLQREVTLLDSFACIFTLCCSMD